MPDEKLSHKFIQIMGYVVLTVLLTVFSVWLEHHWSWVEQKYFPFVDKIQQTQPRGSNEMSPAKNHPTTQNSVQTPYQLNADGTVTQSKTGLIWQGQENETKRPWPAALDYCESLQLAGHSDWRLPTKVELNSLVDFTQNHAEYYWSSSLYESFAEYAWLISFPNGREAKHYKTIPHYVRCVRR